VIEHCWIQAGEEQIRVTIAAGIEVARVQETVDELLDRADRLMWCSKNAGRNIVSSDAGQLARVGDLWPRIRRALDDRTGR
jgi:PleD family two-component response regulator